MKKEFGIPSTLNWLPEAAQDPRYPIFINQLKKDFKRAGLSLILDENTIPESVFTLIKEQLYRLILEDFKSFLNLMYLADVPESALLNERLEDRVQFATLATVVLFEREWNKTAWQLRKS